MKLEGDYLFEASVPEVWSALFDPVILAAVMPGCEKLDLVDGHYVGDIKVKVGPIQGKFTGKVDLQDKVEPESYTMIVDGRGAPGFVKATAHVKLAPEGDATRVRYDADAQVGGKIASVGQRLLDASARAIVAQSLEGLHTNVKLRAAAHREAAAKRATAGETAAAPAEATISDAAKSDPASSDAAKSDPAAKPAGDASVASGEPAWSLEETVKTGAPTYIPVPGDDPTVRTPRPAALETKSADPEVAFTPVKVKQSALANAVAKEVASTLFPRSVLVTIIILEALAIVWLLLRH
jgi:carbon monoxide dehydrogenase subunit G